MPVSRGKDLRHTNLRRAIELCMPGVQTMQGLLAYCAAPAPYPFFEGEMQKNSRRAKEDVVRIKGREFQPGPQDRHYRQPHTCTHFGCRFISPEQKAAS
jgi:hypothetical protein